MFFAQCAINLHDLQIYLHDLLLFFAFRFDIIILEFFKLDMSGIDKLSSRASQSKPPELSEIEPALDSFVSVMK